MVYFNIFKPSSFNHLAVNIFLVRILRIRDKENEWEEEEKIKENVTG
jgi:hypothetical protein